MHKGKLVTAQKENDEQRVASCDNKTTIYFEPSKQHPVRSVILCGNANLQSVTVHCLPTKWY